MSEQTNLLTRQHDRSARHAGYGGRLAGQSLHRPSPTDDPRDAPFIRRYQRSVMSTAKDGAISACGPPPCRSEAAPWNTHASPQELDVYPMITQAGFLTMWHHVAVL